MTEAAKKRIPAWLIPFLTAAFIPLYPMFYLYNQNEQYILLSHVFAFNFVFMLGSAALFAITNKILRSPFSAMAFCMLCWFLFFGYDGIKSFFGITRHRFYLLIAAIFLILVFVMSKIIIIKCKKFIPPILANGIFLVVVFLILFNAGLSIIRTISLGSSVTSGVYKTTFVLNNTLPTPNIYWIHTDGMLGFDSMERFFGDEQEEFTQELESRGFWISREATLAVPPSTQIAIPALMSPHFYDRVMSWDLDPAYANQLPRNSDLFDNTNNRTAINFTSLRLAREKNETIMAFNAAGFNTSTIANIDIYFYPTVNQFLRIQLF